ncbi:16S rRNA (uracil(1498)-N(3))-methyltransferase [Thermotoga sp. KOL6]|uniref:16S rRNA (uracil(1498)-N(3))-methyltransferase n=1 Tax=Thermotoga sp. KOL6 TaxID=126741 RepID=UPI000C762BD7|nr:16S rRNA (uracil(1498)-N(3))-methyltransferase [Thermotoga sp. KOL6]PLV60031.1 16S rRNA methyltransferase [Thermotoga sp. KOL6]
MPHLFYGVVEGNRMLFDEREAHHMRVVRLKEGDTIETTDGEGFSYLCVIERLKKDGAIGTILKSEKKEEESLEKLKVMVPIGRWERTRLLIEKCVELGVDSILLHKFQRSQHDPNIEKAKIVVREAAKQCRRYLFPEIEIMKELSFSGKTITLDLYAQKSLLEVDPEGDLTIVVGPEGGFSEEERKILMSKTTMINLGRKILRFETAAILTVGYIALKKHKI